jgi:hypothetical protein
MLFHAASSLSSAALVSNQAGLRLGVGEHPSEERRRLGDAHGLQHLLHGDQLRLAGERRLHVPVPVVQRRLGLAAEQ